MVKNKHKPPSRLRYENNHPTISFRVERSLYDKLKSLLAEKNQSISDFFKIALGEQQENYENAHNNGYDEGYSIGYNEGYNEEHVRFSLTCKKCGKPMIFDKKNIPEIEQVLTNAFQNWYHTSCIEKSNS